MMKHLSYPLLLVSCGLLYFTGMMSPAQAQEVVKTDATIVEQTVPQLPEYYFGIQCEPIPDILSQHLDLGETGLLILTVAPGGPADKAGVLKGDILLQLAGKNTKKVTDIFAVLERDKDKEQKLKILRKGKKKDIMVKPEKRPEDAVSATPPAGLLRQIQPGIIFRDPHGEDTRKMISRFIEQMEKGEIDLQAFERTDKMLGGESTENVDRFAISIVPGSEAGTQRVRVYTNNEIWDVETLEDLPEELRTLVHRIIGPMESGKNMDMPKIENPDEQMTSKMWDDLKDKIQKELETLQMEVQKLQLPDFEAIFNKYRKAIDEDIESLLKKPESR